MGSHSIAGFRGRNGPPLRTPGKLNTGLSRLAAVLCLLPRSCWEESSHSTICCAWMRFAGCIFEGIWRTLFAICRTEPRLNFASSMRNDQSKVTRGPNGRQRNWTLIALKELCIMIELGGSKTDRRQAGKRVSGLLDSASDHNEESVAAMASRGERIGRRHDTCSHSRLDPRLLCL